MMTKRTKTDLSKGWIAIILLPIIGIIVDIANPNTNFIVGLLTNDKPEFSINISGSTINNSEEIHVPSKTPLQAIIIDKKDDQNIDDLSFQANWKSDEFDRSVSVISGQIVKITPEISGKSTLNIFAQDKKGLKSETFFINIVSYDPPSAEIVAKDTNGASIEDPQIEDELALELKFNKNCYECKYKWQYDNIERFGSTKEKFSISKFGSNIFSVVVTDGFNRSFISSFQLDIINESPNIIVFSKDENGKNISDGVNNITSKNIKIHFDARQSTDKETQFKNLEFVWRLNGETKKKELGSAGAEWQVLFTESGKNVVEAELIDRKGEGKTSKKRFLFEVQNQPPVVQVDITVDGQLVDEDVIYAVENDEIRFDASETEDPDGTEFNLQLSIVGPRNFRQNRDAAALNPIIWKPTIAGGYTASFLVEDAEGAVGRIEKLFNINPAQGCLSRDVISAKRLSPIVLNPTNLATMVIPTNRIVRVEGTLNIPAGLADELLIDTPMLVFEENAKIVRVNVPAQARPNAGAGGNGGNGAVGTRHARTGQPGGNGAPGRNGGTGVNGFSPGGIKIVTQCLEGNIVIENSGSNGGAGGNAGRGGNGGVGGQGDGAHSTTFDCRRGPGHGGRGGNGGVGGNGGNGGNGGSGGAISLLVRDTVRTSSISLTSLAGAGGPGGGAGAGGSLGRGGHAGRGDGPRCSSRPERRGANGIAGVRGRSGAAGQSGSPGRISYELGDQPLVENRAVFNGDFAGL